LRVLRPVARLVPPALRDVISLSGPAVKLLKQAPGLFDAASAALPAITRFTSAFRPAVEALLPAVREVAPMIAIAGNYSQDIVAAMANLGADLQATAPANTTANTLSATGTAHYLRALTPLSPEAVAGQSIRPSTNRHNPYYAPGEQSNLGSSGGGLMSSDCNNTGNASQVPLPIGNGNVPCRVQPPWTFNGVSTYYPHLTRAPGK
jgi:hypothetical protein